MRGGLPLVWPMDKNMHQKETQERKNVKGFRVFLQETLHIDKKNSQNTKMLEP